MVSPVEKIEKSDIVIKIKANQIRQLFSQSWIGQFGILAVAVGLCMILWGKMPHLKLMIWFGLLFVFNTARQVLGVAFKKKAPAGRAVLVWGKRHAIGTTAVAAMWGLALMFLWPPGHPVHQLLMIICVVSVSASTVSLYCSWKPSYLPYVLIPLPLCAIRLLMEPGLIYTVIGVLGVLFTLIMFKSGMMMNAAGGDVLLSDIKNKELSEKLLKEKAIQSELNLRLAEEIKDRKDSELKLHERNEELEQLNQDLRAAKISIEKSMANIKRLNGLLPICASCKKIRNDDGYWEQLEEYLQEHSEAAFSHGLCPDCAAKLYPEIFEE